MIFRPEITRPPAFAGLTPVGAEFRPLESEEAHFLRRATGRDGRVSRLESAGHVKGTGVFRIEPEADPATWLVAKVAAEKFEHWNEVESLLAGLPDDAPALRCLPGFPTEVSDGRAIALFPWIQGRHPSATTGDVRRVGAALAKLHLGLKSLPLGQTIKDRSEIRRKMLSEIVKHRDNTLPLAPIPVGPVLEAWPFDPPLAGGQPLHGDCNAGNILLRTDSNEVALLDFEDLPYSWGSPLQDIALAIERLCLATAEFPEQGLELVRSFAAGYASIAPVPPGSLSHAMAYVNIQAIATLLGLAAAGHSRPVTEWQKFVDLLATLRQCRESIENAWSQRASTSDDLACGC